MARLATPGGTTTTKRSTRGDDPARRRLPLTRRSTARHGARANAARRGSAEDVPNSDYPKRRIPIGLSTSSVFPKGLEEGFRLARDCGYDGVEVMVSSDPASRSARELGELAEKYGTPILSLHAPTLFLLQNVWGLAPWPKVERTAALARELGVPTIVAHPPFRWQGTYARGFASGVHALEERYGVDIAVENMYPWRMGLFELMIYYPHWNPVDLNYRHVTIDLSHAATSGSDVLAMIDRLGPRLSHIHLADGGGRSLRDEHAIPGEGTQPCAEVLRRLSQRGWTGSVLVEVNTRSMSAPGRREEALARTARFARAQLGHHLPAPGETGSPASRKDLR